MLETTRLNDTRCCRQACEISISCRYFRVPWCKSEVRGKHKFKSLAGYCGITSTLVALFANADGELPRTFLKRADRSPVLYTRAAPQRICRSGQRRGPAPGPWLRAKCDTDCNGVRIRPREGPNAVSSQLGASFSARRIRRPKNSTRRRTAAGTAQST